MKPESKRVTIELSENAINRLERLCEKTEAATFSEVVRNSLRAYDLITTDAASGAKFFTKTANGEMVEIRFF